MAKSSGFKPRNAAHHEALLATGEVRPVAIEPPAVFRHVPTGDTYGQAVDGAFLTGFLALMLDESPEYRVKPAGPKLLREFARGARGVLAVLSSPVAGVLAVKFGVNLAPARALAGALAADGPAAQALALVDLWGPRRLQAMADELRRRLADGELSAEDQAAVIAAGLGVPA